MQTFSGDEEHILCYPAPMISLGPDIAVLNGPVQLAHLVLRNAIQPGSQVVDATCGNGHDTLLLAGLVGPEGHVRAFDIQDEAILATGKRLAEAGLSRQVSLIRAGHEKMTEHVPPRQQAIVFNLGYRPGGDRSIVTRPETTLSALAQAVQLVAPRGIVAITVYPGHGGGREESNAIDAWAGQLDQQAFHVWRMGQLNASGNGPYFILIQKAA